jgi:hypothetical protein
MLRAAPRCVSEYSTRGDLILDLAVHDASCLQFAQRTAADGSLVP